MIKQEVVQETQALVKTIENQVVGFKVKSQKDLEDANQKLVKITSAEKQVTERERKMLDPMNQAKKEVIDFWRPAKIKLDSFKKVVKAEIGKYLDILEEKEKEKKQEVEQKVEAGEMKMDTATKKLEKIEEKKGVVSVRIERKVEITDKEKIPKEYWVLDMVSIRRDALSGRLTQGVKVVEIKNIIGKR